MIKYRTNIDGCTDDIKAIETAFNATFMGRTNKQICPLLQPHFKEPVTVQKVKNFKSHIRDLRREGKLSPDYKEAYERVCDMYSNGHTNFRDKSLEELREIAESLRKEDEEKERQQLLAYIDQKTATAVATTSTQKVPAISTRTRRVLKPLTTSDFTLKEVQCRTTKSDRKIKGTKKKYSLKIYFADGELHLLEGEVRNLKSNENVTGIFTSITNKDGKIHTQLSGIIHGGAVYCRDRIQSIRTHYEGQYSVISLKRKKNTPIDTDTVKTNANPPSTSIKPSISPTFTLTKEEQELSFVLAGERVTRENNILSFDQQLSGAMAEVGQHQVFSAWNQKAQYIGRSHHSADERIGSLRVDSKSSNPAFYNVSSLERQSDDTIIAYWDVEKKSSVFSFRGAITVSEIKKGIADKSLIEDEGKVEIQRFTIDYNIIKKMIESA